jgi:large repetitive protein
VDHANGSASLYLGQDFAGFPGGYHASTLNSYGLGTDFPTTLSIMNFSGTGQHDLATVNQGSTPSSEKIRVLTSKAAGSSFTLAATFTNPSSSMNLPTSIATGRFDVRSTHDDIVWSDPPPGSLGGNAYLDQNSGYALKKSVGAETSTSGPIAQSPAVAGQPVSITSQVIGVPTGTGASLWANGTIAATGTTNAQGQVTFFPTFSAAGNQKMFAIFPGTDAFLGSASPWTTLNVSSGGTPFITGVTPNNGPVGSTVTMSGSNFTGATQVLFNGIPATTFSVTSDSVITATVPAGGSGVITVITPVGSTINFEVGFLVQPVITSVTPTSGPPGTTRVTIDGSGFTGVNAVTFNGVPSLTTAVSDKRIIVVVPSTATTGLIGLSFTNSRQVTTNSTFAVTSACPAITVVGGNSQSPAPAGLSAYPSSVTASGGTSPYTFSAVGLPPGLRLDAGAAVSTTVSGTPTQVGTYSVTITATDANGCTGSETFPFVVNDPHTIILLGSSANPSVFGQGLIFNATVSETGSGTLLTPTGSIQLAIDGSNLGTPISLVNGAAAFPAIATLLPGAHTVQVSYPGDNKNFSSSATLTQSVNEASTTTTLSCTPVSPVFSQQVSCNAHVAVTPGITLIPVGSITLVDSVGNATIGVAVVDVAGNASVHTSTLPVGQHSVTAKFLGSSNFASSASATVPLNVTAANTTTTLSCSASTAVYGQRITCVIVVGSNSPATAIPTGSVTLIDLPGNTSIASGPLDTSGQATITVDNLPPGLNGLTPTFNGDANFNRSIGVGQNVNVTKASFTLLTTCSSPVTLGVPTSCSTAATPVAPSTRVVNDVLVQDIVDGKPGHSCTITNGVCTTTETLSTTGTHTISATAAAPSNYKSATSPSFTLTVTSAATVNLLTTITSETHNTTTQQYIFPLTVTNMGSGPANDVKVTAATVNGIATTSPLPSALGSLAANGSVTFVLNFPDTVAATGSPVVMQVHGTYAGGTYAASFRLIL